MLAADPLRAVTPSHFFWASVLAGYLLYDTIYSLAFFSVRSGAAFLLHHAVGLAGCGLGLYANKLALFGTAIEVFFEATTPLLHVSLLVRSCGGQDLGGWQWVGGCNIAGGGRGRRTKRGQKALLCCCPAFWYSRVPGC